jgi:hypothetical protein
MKDITKFIAGFLLLGTLAAYWNQILGALADLSSLLDMKPVSILFIIVMAFLIWHQS